MYRTFESIKNWQRYKCLNIFVIPGGNTPPTKFSRGDTSATLPNRNGRYQGTICTSWLNFYTPCKSQLQNAWAVSPTTTCIWSRRIGHRTNVAMWNALPIGKFSVPMTKTVGGLPRCLTMRQTSAVLSPCGEGHRLRLSHHPGVSPTNTRKSARSRGKYCQRAPGLAEPSQCVS